METQRAVEDINAVLGRFQAWAGVRNAVEVKAGVRELSDEEALKSSRYKWKGASKPVEKKVHNEAEQATAASAGRSESTRKVAKKAGVKERMTKEAVGTKVVAKATAVARVSTQPDFREVLAETVRGSEIVATVQPVEVARQVAISVRFAPEERALIRVRAVEAGVSASAYIRQCALEVEQLRTQVQQAIAAMERGSSTPVQGSVTTRGLFARIARRIFPRNAPSLALRA